MENNTSILTDEQIEAVQRFVAMANEIVETITGYIKQFLDAIRKFGEYLGRILFYCQLREWRIPHKLSLFVSRKFPAYWAMRFGFSWFARVHRLA